MRKATKRRKGDQAEILGRSGSPDGLEVLPPAHVPVLGGPISDEERRAAERANLHQLAERFGPCSSITRSIRHRRVRISTLLLRLARISFPASRSAASPGGTGGNEKMGRPSVGALLANVARLRKRGGLRKSPGERLPDADEMPRFAARYGHENPRASTGATGGPGIVRVHKLLGKMVARAEARWISLDDWSVMSFGQGRIIEGIFA